MNHLTNQLIVVGGIALLGAAPWIGRLAPKLRPWLDSLHERVSQEKEEARVWF
jgi:hypothetical protein